MLAIKHILVVLDHEQPEQFALDRAVTLARSLKADLTLLTTAFESYCEEGSSFDEATRVRIRSALINQRQAWLDSYLGELSDITTQTEVHWQKQLHDAVIESVRQQSFDLVIKGTQPHHLIDRIFTHTDWNLLRHCPAPVMLVKSAQPWRHNRLLAAIDATSTDLGHLRINDNILSFAEHLADHFETDLHVANAYPLVSVAFAMVPEVTAPDDIQGYISRQHEEACELWAKKFSIHADHVHVGEGDADHVITDFANAIDADLVVVGTTGRKGIAGVLIGNTAEALVDKVHCDVLVIKPDDGVAVELE